MNENGVWFVVSSWWIDRGKWRSYNMKYFVSPTGKNGWEKTTALGDIIVKFHRDFYKGIENGTINWKMK